jgi:predicted aldo/keto reductase-like oxidoreductase
LAKTLRSSDAYQDWTFCQIRYNFPDEETQAGTDGLHYAASRKLGIVVMEPLRGGKLAAPNGEISAIWNAAPAKRSAAEWALDWVWNHPEVSLLFSGMGTLAQVQQNLGAAGMSEAGMLAPGELDLIARVQRAYNALIRVPCTACSYCMPCPQSVNMPGMFQLVDERSMFGNRDMQRKRYGHMRGERSSADSCIRWGACEENCPRHISIRDQLADVAEQLG